MKKYFSIFLYKYQDFFNKYVLCDFFIFTIVCRKFAPKCSVCQYPIMPEVGQDETVRFVALDRSFHVQCYRCEVSK